jgi:hydroxymethylbilane synthase
VTALPVRDTSVAPLVPTTAPDRLVLAVGGGRLARARADAVARDLRAAWPDLAVEIRVVAAPGDSPDRAASESAAGVSVAAVRAAVRTRRADVAVHHFADLPPGGADGLVVGAVPLRGDPRDALVSRTGKVLTYLPPGTRVGAGTPGRGAQLLRRRRDLVIVPVAGDVDARLARLATAEYDAVVLSAAALADLDLLARVAEYFDTDQLIPRPGQAAVALEQRVGDVLVASRLAPLHDVHSAHAVTAERACLAHLGAAIDTPLGIYGVTDGTTTFVHGIVATADGTRAARLRWTGPWRDPEDAGTTLAELLLGAGAREILSGDPIPPTIDFAAEHRRRIAEAWDAPYPPEEA